MLIHITAQRYCFFLIYANKITEIYIMLTELSKITHFAQNLSIFTHFAVAHKGSV